MAHQDNKPPNDSRRITDRWTQYHDGGKIITHAPFSPTGNKGGRPLSYQDLAPVVLSPTTKIEYPTRDPNTALPTPPPTASGPPPAFDPPIVSGQQGNNPYSRHYSIYSTTPHKYLQGLNRPSRLPTINEASEKPQIHRDHSKNAQIPITAKVGNLTGYEVYKILQQQEHELAKEKTVLLVNLNVQSVKDSGGTLKSSLNIPAWNFQDSSRTVLYLVLGRPEINRVVFYDDITGKRTKDQARLFQELCYAHKAQVEVYVMANGLNQYMKTALTDDEHGYRMVNLVEGLDLGYWIRLHKLPGYQAIQD